MRGRAFEAATGILIADAPAVWWSRCVHGVIRLSWSYSSSFGAITRSWTDFSGVMAR